MPFIALALVLAAAVGGGTSLAAQQALPGDVLWKFKVVVNENVGAALAPSGKAQADFDLARIEDRLREAQKLKAEDRLSAEAEAAIAANIEAHAKSVEQEVAALRAQGETRAAADVAARYQASLAASGSTIAKVHTILESASSLSAELTAEINL